ncbi:MAG: 1-deoxy-D-xylulose-5-phosphate reductoisomerase [Rhodospirillales bacterium]
MTDRDRTENRAPKSLTILGSTGSVGCSTLDLVERQPERFTIKALTANSNVEQLAAQAKAHDAELAVVADDGSYRALKAALSGTGIRVAAGAEGLAEAAALQSDMVMAAIVGAAGLTPTLIAAERGADVALANKECLVCSGDILLDAMKRGGGALLPVDSEHNAIFQVFDFDKPEGIEKIILTASGGPFRKASLAEMKQMTPQQAVAHPNWSMGAKISVDSATMMNKGLELIEAFHLFPVTGDQIEIVVHPQSVIHSMVGYVDGSVLAQLGSPDMRTPIAYALAWPERMQAPVARLDFSVVTSLTFEQPDTIRFPALRLAREALDAGGGMPTILNAANEVGVAHFLKSRIGFLDICAIVEECMQRLGDHRVDTIEEIKNLDATARQIAESLAAERVAA